MTVTGNGRALATIFIANKHIGARAGMPAWDVSSATRGICVDGPYALTVVPEGVPTPASHAI